MYNSLELIDITCKLLNSNYNIIFDNKNKSISVNNIKIDNIDYNDYLNKLLRIIRFYKIDKSNDMHDVMIKVKEIDKEYLYYIDNLLPDNYDSFIDLMLEIVDKCR